jgi:hypothetical protein
VFSMVDGRRVLSHGVDYHAMCVNGRSRIV